MKKILIGAAIVLAIGGYLWWSMRGPAAPSSTATSVPYTSVPGYKDGTYTGGVAESVYGPVQVAVTITGGKIVSVDMLRYPMTPGHTTEVSSASIPVLKQEVIRTQKAQVDIVSEATQTSDAFEQSLVSALAQAS